MFRKKPTAAEVARESKRDIGQATRGLDREILSLQQEEKKLILEIKRTAKAGNEASTKILAKNLVRIRGQIARMQNSKAQLRGISTHVQTAHSTVAVAGAVGKAGNVMKQANAQMDPIKAQKIAMDFQKEASKMELAQEVLGDTVDGVLDSDDVEEESEALTNEVLESLGVETSAQLASAPRGRVAGSANVLQAEGDFSSAEDDDLERRLAALRS